MCRSHADLIADADLVADRIAHLVADPVADAYADTISGSRFPSRALLLLGVLIWAFRGTHWYPQGTGGVLRCAVWVLEGVLEGFSRGTQWGYFGVHG